MARIAVIVALLGLALASCASDCGCLDNVYLYAALPENVDQLASGTATLCRNGACATGQFLPAPMAGSELLLFGDGVCGEALLTEDVGGTADVRFSPGAPSNRCPKLSYADGDTYEISVVAASGAVLIDRTAQAVYQHERVCGGAPATHAACTYYMVTLQP